VPWLSDALRDIARAPCGGLRLILTEATSNDRRGYCAMSAVTTTDVAAIMATTRTFRIGFMDTAGSILVPDMLVTRRAISTVCSITKGSEACLQGDCPRCSRSNLSQ
jgi:hypothetical protein